MTDQEPGSMDDGGPASPPIPSFASLRSPQRRSAIDLMLFPEPDDGPASAAAPESREPEPEAAVPTRTPPARTPRPAEWADLLRLATHLGGCVVHLVTTRGARRR